MLEAGATQPRAGARGDDQRDVAAEVAERRDVEVVPVEMGEDHEVDPVEPAAMGDGFHPAERADARSRDRIGQDADPVQLDQDGRVADELEGEPPRQRQVLRAASG